MQGTVQVPDGWRVARLGDVAEIVFSSVDKKTRDGETPVRLCNYTDVFYNRRIHPEMGFMVATASPIECERWALRKGDVLFTKDSETPDEIGIPAYVTADMPEVLCGYHLGLARPRLQTIDGAFLADMLGSRASARQFARAANGVTRFGLTLDATRSLPLLLPPLAEQRAIAAVLDAIDDAIERTEAVIATTERLRDALLHDLLTRGVPGWHSKWRDVPGLGTIPTDWEVVRLGDECERITKGTTPTTLGHTYAPAGVRFLRVENVSDDGTISGGGTRFIDADTHRLLSRSVLQDNDVVLSIAGALGRSALITRTILPANVNQALAIIRLARDSRLLAFFLSLAFRGQSVQLQVNDMRAELAQANISLQQVGDLRIALPAKAEQHAIVAMLESADKSIERAREGRDGLQSLKASASDVLLSGRVRTRR